MSNLGSDESDVCDLEKGQGSYPATATATSMATATTTEKASMKRTATAQEEDEDTVDPKKALVMNIAVVRSSASPR